MPGDGQMRIAHYVVVRMLGRGGSGIVHQATDEATGRDVALKLLLPELAGDEHRRRRLMREAHAASCIEHPNVARLLEVGEDEGRIYLAMELVEGSTLRALLTQGPLAVDEAMLIGRQIAAAAAAAHDKGIVHRDLKPENVMLSAGRVVKVLDFGLAKNIDAVDAGGGEDTVSQLTEEGRVLGTPGYMSPEQTSAKPLDARTDVFSLGVVLYEMVTGRRPFSGESNVEVMIAVHRDAPVPPSKLAPTVSAALEEVILRCLAKRPADRYATAAEVRDALERADAPGTISGSAVPAPPRRPGGTWMLIVAAAVLVPIAGALTWQAWPRDAALPVEASSVAAPSPPKEASACDAFRDAARWKSFSPTSQGGYVFTGGAFDGTHVYFAPAGPKGVTRYDTRSAFDGATSWTTESAGARGPLSSGARVGRHVYFGGKIAAQYDSGAPFDAASSWRTFDVSTKAPGLETAGTGGFDGRHLYFVPVKSGKLTRFDTTRTFTDAAAWEAFDINSLLPGGVCTDCTGGVFDGRYVYVVPQYAPGSIAARYDTTKPFAVAASWQTFDLGRVDPGAKSFAGAAFDGRHVYLAPYANAVIRATGVALRFDVSKGFADETAWSVFHTTAIAPPTGFQFLGWDGRHLYYVPYFSWYEAGSAYASTIVRYDTDGPFDASSSWCSFDLTSVSPAARGYAGAMFDGEHMYFAPFDTGAPVIRHFVKTPKALPTVPAGFTGSF